MKLEELISKMRSIVDLIEEEIGELEEIYDEEEVYDIVVDLMKIYDEYC